MKRRLFCLMPALVMALLTGCALAQPVRESAGADRWVGYYMVYVPQDVMDAGSDSDLRPQGIVWGEWDETTETITFPDMAGSALLMFGREDERITVPSVTEMSPGPEESRVSSSEQGDSFSVSGTVWWGPPLDAPADWDREEDGGGWLPCLVYRTPAGGFYLDADTPFYSFSSGGSVFHQSDYTYRDDGGTLRTDTLRMTVAMEYTPRLTALRVVEFDGNDQPLRTTDLPLSEDMPAVTAGPDAAWVAVEEESAEGVERTSYSLTEGEPVVHEVILLDEDGGGWGVDLTIGQ